MTRRLSHQEIEQYRELGYVVLPELFGRERLDELRRENEAMVRAAAKVTVNDEVYDLEDSHDPANPRVRRIKTPHCWSAVFNAMVSAPEILDVLEPLIGPAIRLHGTKLNMKSAGYGAPVEWHQDWAFYPHTNDDVLATGLYLDDCEEGNGPLMVLPGSHKGPLFDHHAGGYFCGALDPAASGLDFAKAAKLMGPAGSLTIHHVRAVHGSAINTSNRPRRLLLHEYAAADAWPLMGMLDSFEDFNARVVRGAPTIEPRVTPGPVRMPLPPASHEGSIYENQKGASRRFFSRLEDVRAAE